MNHRQVQDFLDPQFGYLAKSSGEQLSAHHFTCWSVFRKIARYIPSLDEKDKELIEVACLIHDIAKKNEKNQRILRGIESGQVIHKPTYEEVVEYIDNSPLSLSDKDKKTIFDLILTHHSVSDGDLRGITTPSAGILTELLRFSDWIASMDEVMPETVGRIRDNFSGLLDITYAEVSRFPSPTTYLLLGMIIEEYKNAGWESLLLLDNGAIFIAKGVNLPSKDTVIKEALNLFFDQSLGVQAVYSPNFTKNFLGGLSRLFPASFMKAKDHRGKIIDNLSDIERKGVQFLRLLFDILSLDSIAKIRRELSIWNLIPSCLGPSGHRKVKEEKWHKFFKEDAPSSINAEAIGKLFSKLILKETIPSLHLGKFNSEWHKKRLADLKPDQLFEILYAIAAYYEEKGVGTQELKEYLEAIISMEEEKEFASISQEVFERYKRYKTTFDVSKGLCERCACPVPISAQPSLRLPQWGFSQVKSRPDGACASCPFCAYDNMVLKEKGKGVYLRISSKIPALLSFYPEVSRFVAKLDAGLRAPYQIVALKEREEFCSLPFPKRIRIPLPKKEMDQEAESILRNEQGTLFAISFSKDSGPKDLKAKYEPLYHILNLLGFKAEIGEEEQIGLLGERKITSLPAYYQSLAVLILATILRRKGKKSKEYIFASELFEKSPSVAMRKVADSFGEKKGTCKKGCKDYTENKCNCIPYNFFCFALKGGDSYMRGILEDAAFLADKEKGIPHFCVEPEERGNFWKGLSKHSASKPIAQGLDELMMGRGIEYGLERFLRNISKKIGEKEQDELKSFVEKTKDVLKKYEALRKEDITGFIRAKNALCSAVYIFTRYQNLKEVVKDG